MAQKAEVESSENLEAKGQAIADNIHHLSSVLNGWQTESPNALQVLSNHATTFLRSGMPDGSQAAINFGIDEYMPYSVMSYGSGTPEMRFDYSVREKENRRAGYSPIIVENGKIETQLPVMALFMGVVGMVNQADQTLLSMDYADAVCLVDVIDLIVPLVKDIGASGQFKDAVDAVEKNLIRFKREKGLMDQVADDKDRLARKDKDLETANARADAAEKANVKPVEPEAVGPLRQQFAAWREKLNAFEDRINTNPDEGANLYSEFVALLQQVKDQKLETHFPREVADETSVFHRLRLIDSHAQINWGLENDLVTSQTHLQAANKRAEAAEKALTEALAGANKKEKTPQEADIEAGWKNIENDIPTFKNPETSLDEMGRIFNRVHSFIEHYEENTSEFVQDLVRQARNIDGLMRRTWQARKSAEDSAAAEKRQEQIAQATSNELAALRKQIEEAGPSPEPEPPEVGKYREQYRDIILNNFELIGAPNTISLPDAKSLRERIGTFIKEVSESTFTEKLQNERHHAELSSMLLTSLIINAERLETTKQQLHAAEERAQPNPAQSPDREGGMEEESPEVRKLRDTINQWYVDLADYLKNPNKDAAVTKRLYSTILGALYRISSSEEFIQKLGPLRSQAETTLAELKLVYKLEKDNADLKVQLAQVNTVQREAGGKQLEGSAAASAEVESLKKQVAELAVAKASLEEEKDALQAQSGNLQNKLEEQKQRNDALDARMQALDSSITALEDKLKEQGAITATLNDANETLGRLQAELESNQAELRLAVDQASAAEQRESIALAKVGQLETELQTIKQRLQELEAQAAEAEPAIPKINITPEQLESLDELIEFPDIGERKILDILAINITDIGSENPENEEHEVSHKEEAVMELLKRLGFEGICEDLQKQFRKRGKSLTVETVIPLYIQGLENYIKKELPNSDLAAEFITHLQNLETETTHELINHELDIPAFLHRR